MKTTKPRVAPHPASPRCRYATRATSATDGYINQTTISDPFTILTNFKVRMSGNEIFKPKNVAAWQLKKKERPFVVDSAPYTSPPEDHVTVQVVDVAVNPIDWVEQDSELFELEYPNIFGLDVAGEVVEVGKGVDEFRVGQRVIAYVSA